MNARISQQNLHPQKSHISSSTLDQSLVLVEKLMQRLAHGRRVDRAGSMVVEHLLTGGKRIRARLALQACASFGVESSTAIKWAAAIELLHNATLIHDDIQDGDTTRRGHATTWATHGVAQAINAGDLMLMLPFLAVAEMNDPAKSELSLLIAEAATRVVRGQVEELGLKSAGHLDLDSYLSACRGKTGALIALPVVGAALLGGRSVGEAHALGEQFIQLGVLFQIQDDVVDLFGDKGRKQVGCDIYEGKVSALLVAHLECAPETRPLAMRILNKPREKTTPRDVETMRTLYLLSGALDRVIDMICDIRTSVLSSKQLSREPELHALASKLLQMALAPLQRQADSAVREYAS